MLTPQHKFEVVVVSIPSPAQAEKETRERLREFQATTPTALMWSWPWLPLHLTAPFPHSPSAYQMHKESQRNHPKWGARWTWCWSLVMEIILESLPGRSGVQQLPSAQSFSEKGNGFEYQHEEFKIDAGRLSRQKDYSALWDIPACGISPALWRSRNK